MNIINLYEDMLFIMNDLGLSINNAALLLIPTIALLCWRYMKKQGRNELMSQNPIRIALEKFSAANKKKSEEILKESTVYEHQVAGHTNESNLSEFNYLLMSFKCF